MFQSEIYDVLDFKYIDVGTGRKSNITSNVTGNRVTLTCSTNNYGLYYLSTNGQTSGEIYNPVGTIYEFTLIEETGTIQLRLDGQTTGSKSIQLPTNLSNAKIRIEHNSNSIIVKQDGATIITEAVSSDNRRFGFNIDANESITYESLGYY